MAAFGDTSMASRGGSRWIGWVIIVLFAVMAVALSIRDSGMREGRSGSYLGRTVTDGTAPTDAQRALSTRLGSQNY